MDLVIQAYSVEEGKTRDGPNCAIPRECIPSWDNLARWAGQQILEERKQPFQSAIESFIVAYSDRRDREGNPLSNRDLKLPKVCLAWDFLGLFHPMGLNAGPGRRSILEGYFLAAGLIACEANLCPHDLMRRIL